MVNAMSWVLVPALLGPIVGPPVGGFIVTYFNWRWIFFLNLPMGLLGAALVTRYFAPCGAKRHAFRWPRIILSGCRWARCFRAGDRQPSRQGWPALGLIVFGAGTGWLYLRHARRTAEPILDLRLMWVASFRNSMIAGSLTRVTQGAQPFLLPLMMQLGSPDRDAERTGDAGDGVGLHHHESLCTRHPAPLRLSRQPDRGRLHRCGGYGLCALFRPGWPFPLIFAILIACGFFMSFQFTAYNTIAYDRIPGERLGPATSFYTTFQQLMLSVASVSGDGAGRRDDLARPCGAEPAGFLVAFVLVCAVSLAAFFWNRKFLPPMASSSAAIPRAPGRCARLCATCGAES